MMANRNWLTTAVSALVLPYAAASLGETSCELAGVAVDRDFAGAAYARCAFEDDGRLRLTIVPEDPRINPSPWYAFRLTSTSPVQQRVVLDYGEVEHRYWPDLREADGGWRMLHDSEVIAGDDLTELQLALSLSPAQPLTVAAQPLLLDTHYSRWIGELVATGRVENDVVARSRDDRPIHRLTSEPKPHTLLLLGRQHPPETTGAVAMLAFVQRLLEDDSLALAFRDEVGLLIYPLLNPDGVARGHWRHNAGGTDLNRDWGRFSQPETREVAEDIDRFLAQQNSQLVKSIDFHSTHYEVFYTQEDGTATVMPGLLSDWLADFGSTMLDRQPDFELNRKASHNPDRPTAKSYFSSRYGVASTTLEIGDSTAEAYIRGYAIVAAEAFMRAWLQRS